jgi:dTDP-4-amino-4,6-dideoxygalactose transaminase
MVDNMKNIPFYKASSNENELNLITDVLENNTNSKVTEFENDIKKYLGTKHAISVVNVSTALSLALSAIDLKRGDKVLMSVNTFPNAPEAVRHFDSDPIFIDIASNSYNIDLDKFEEYLKNNNSKKLRAAIINFVAGELIDLERLYSLCKEYKIILIEDASSALGATYDDELLGTLEANMTIFSMNQAIGKHAVSNCGIIVTSDDDIAKRATLLRTHGITSDYDEYGDLDYLYDVVDIGYKYDISELEAAFNIAQLKKTNQFIARRVEIANIYSQRLSGLKHIKVPMFCEDQIYTQYIIEISKNRDAFARELKDEGVSTGLNYIPLHLLTYYKNKYKLKIMAYPNALNSYGKILSLPIYAAMSDEDIHYVCDKIIEIENKWI